MRKKEINRKMFAAVIIAVCIMGCSERADNDSKEPEAVSAEIEKNMESSETENRSGENRLEENIPEENMPEDPKREEIIIDYPFEESLGYKLTLAKLPDLADEYELVLYDKEGEVLQQIPCGRLEAPIEFSYDRMRWHDHDLEIFPSGSKTGLLFLQEEEGFAQEAIKIPRYAEISGGDLVTIVDNEDYLEKHFYTLNIDKKRADEIRNLRIDRNTGQLEIHDELENKCIYEGIVELDKDGNPANSKFYDMLLWQNKYNPSNFSNPSDDEEESLIRVWVEEKPRQDTENHKIEGNSFEEILNDMLETPGHSQKFESIQAFLTEFGFENCEPVYQYFDLYGNPQLDLYADDRRENYCGIVYFYSFNCDLQKMTECAGFTICNVSKEEWKEPDWYLLKSIYGTKGVDEVEDYEEKIKYRTDGKVDCSEATGVMDSWDDKERESILKLDFIYREDGTLYCRDYYHNEKIFGTTESTLNSFYDEKERVAYESGYITHGFVEYYYIYEDESDKPTYCLYLDYNLGYVIPQMVRYR